MNTNSLRQILSEHRGKVAGGLLGLVTGLCIIVFGFWQTVLLFACIALGVYLGRKFDQHDGLQTILQRFWPGSD